MKDLLQISTSTIGAEKVNSVDAREIHEHLEVKTRFNDWIQRAIEKYDFEENVDFYSFLSKTSGRPSIEFIVTLDMAKELAMLENNPKGKEIRKYFIRFEKEGKKVIQSQNVQIQLMQETLNQLSIMDNRVTTTESEVEYLKNKAPIVYNQIKILEDKRKARTKQLVGYDPKDEYSKDRYSRTIRALTKKFKEVFGVARYADLPKDRFSDAMVWLNDIDLGDLV